MMKTPNFNKVQSPLLNPPSYIVYNDIRILIIDTPSANNMSRYIKVNCGCFSFVTNKIQIILFYIGV